MSNNPQADREQVERMKKQLASRQYLNSAEAIHAGIFTLSNGAVLKLYQTDKGWIIRGEWDGRVNTIALTNEAVEVVMCAFLKYHAGPIHDVTLHSMKPLHEEVGVMAESLTAQEHGEE